MTTASARARPLGTSGSRPQLRRPAGRVALPARTRPPDARHRRHSFAPGRRGNGRPPAGRVRGGPSSIAPRQVRGERETDYRRVDTRSGVATCLAPSRTREAIHLTSVQPRGPGTEGNPFLCRPSQELPGEAEGHASLRRRRPGLRRDRIVVGDGAVWRQLRAREVGTAIGPRTGAEREVLGRRDHPLVVADSAPGRWRAIHLCVAADRGAVGRRGRPPWRGCRQGAGGRRCAVLLCVVADRGPGSGEAVNLASSQPGARGAESPPTFCSRSRAFYRDRSTPAVASAGRAASRASRRSSAASASTRGRLLTRGGTIGFEGAVTMYRSLDEDPTTRQSRWGTGSGPETGCGPWLMHLSRLKAPDPK